MRILAINAGSSSIRMDILDVSSDSVRRIAGYHGDGPGTGAGSILHQFLARKDAGQIEAVAHRIVHGGARLVQPCLLDLEIQAEIERLAPLAPLHNPRALNWIRACRETFGPLMPQVGVFDTAFFANLPAVARTYALPRDLTERYGLRRYGFHGLAHEAMWRRWRSLQADAALEPDSRVISLQLGAGCSISATRNGAPLETSMGFSPLEGLVMATRSGDVDPGLLLYLQRTLPMAAEQMEDMLNTASGLLGISGHSADMRSLLASEEPAARLAVDLYCHRARKYVGAFLAVLGGADAIVIGGGVGENAPVVRRKILAGMEWAGIRLDGDANDRAVGIEACISPQAGSDASAVQVWVTNVDEAVVLGEKAFPVIQSAASRGSHP